MPISCISSTYVEVCSSSVKFYSTSQRRSALRCENGSVSHVFLYCCAASVQARLTEIDWVINV